MQLLVVAAAVQRVYREPKGLTTYCVSYLTTTYSDLWPVVEGGSRDLIELSIVSCDYYTCLVGIKGKASVVLCMEAESSASAVQSMKVYYETRALVDD